MTIPNEPNSPRAQSSPAHLAQPALSAEQVLTLAKLAHLQLSPQRVHQLQHELSSVLDSMRILQTLDLAQLAPLTHVSEAFNILRDDSIGESLPKGTAASLPERTLSDREDLAPFIHVPKVLNASDEGSA